jgi:hypothetical protein
MVAAQQMVAADILRRSMMLMKGARELCFVLPFLRQSRAHVKR